MTATPQAQAELVQLQIAFPDKRLANLEACEKAQFADDGGNSRRNWNGCPALAQTKDFPSHRFQLTH